MQTLEFQHAVVLGATGPTGRALVDLLLAAGIPTRVSSRSGRHLAECFAELPVEQVVANDGNIDDARRAMADCDLVFDCIGLPPRQMVHHIKIAQTIATVLTETGARGVFVSNYWSYLPAAQLPLSEDHPRVDGSSWMKLRRHAEQVMLSAGAAVIHLPDFFGPHVTRGVATQALLDSIKGTINWIGDPQISHEYVYVPDAMSTVMAIAQQPAAYGERWIVPGAGPISGEQIRDLAAEHLPHAVKLRSAGLTLLRLLSLGWPLLRGFRQMLPEYVKPITFDGSKLDGLLGSEAVPPTAYLESIPATLDWLDQHVVGR